MKKYIKILIGLTILCISIFSINIFNLSDKSDDTPIVSIEPTEIVKPVKTVEPVEPVTEEPKPLEILTDTKTYEYTKINPDVVGYLTIEGTNVDYPVLQSKYSPNFYLKHDIYKNPIIHGELYIGEHCSIDVPNSNLVIYGHNMKDGSYFKDLIKYTDRNFYENHKIINLETLYDVSDYEIVSVFITEPKDFDYHLYNDFENEEEFQAFFEKAKTFELYDIDVEVTMEDEFIILSTCEYTKEDGRFVVMAKKIGE